MTKKTRVALAGLVLLLAGGCAYFNTLYNAKARYREAASQPLDREGNVPRSAETMYQEVIDKCHKMIRTWPDSRHVDDARLLIARSYFGAARYDKAVAAADTLIELHPKTDLMPKAMSLKGIALARADRFEEAVDVLATRYDTYGPTPQVLYSLCTSLMSIDRSDDAVKYLGVLEKKYPNESETFDARIAIAEILDEKGQLDESRAVYERLTQDRIPETFRYRVWMGFADVDIKLERYADALATLEQLETLTLKPDEEPPMMLLKASAEAGADSIEASIKTYKDIAGRFSRGEFAAEANYRLGTIHEEMDSLEAAQKYYSAVPKAYANSEFAQEALRRSNNLSQLMKLEAAVDDDSPEAGALRTFSMAELQLFQFENTEKALAAYQKILDEYPDTDLAPKAAYAVGYIYGVIEADSAKAWSSYRLLIDRYPDSQQAGYADQIVAAYGGAERRGWTAPVDSMKTAAPPASGPSATDKADAVKRRRARDATRRRSAAMDSSKVHTPAARDTTRAKASSAAADTTGAKASSATADTTNAKTPSAAADSTAKDKKAE